MVQKKYLVILAAVVYIVLAYFLWWFEKPQIESSSFDYCTVGEACLRFCCKNETLCEENFIKKNFNTIHDAPMNVSASFGKPECTLSTLQTTPKSIKFEGKWKIEKVKYFVLFHHFY
jgi:hypothetical protein